MENGGTLDCNSNIYQFNVLRWQSQEAKTSLPGDKCAKYMQNKQLHRYIAISSSRGGGGAGSLAISGWECAAKTLEPLAYTRASSSKF